MKKKLLVTFAFIFAFCALIISIGSLTGWVNAGSFRQTSRWGNPSVVSYQGQIWDGETPYNGVGYFKFAIVDGLGVNQYWSNDGKDPIIDSVPLPVQNGLFHVLLGDTSLTGMTEPLLPEVFYDTDRQIRVWFSKDDSTFTQMPDQVIAAAPYAYASGSAAYAAHLGSYLPEDFQLRISGACTEGQVIKEILADGGVVCESVPGSGTFNISLVDPREFLDYPSIAIGTDGFGLISYYDRLNKDLLVSHCENVNCSSVVSTTLDSTGDVGFSSSVAIGTDGLGLISYHDQSNYDLKVAHCGNSACTEADINTVDTIHGGFFNSITIGADGLGLIAHIDGTDLRISHCSDLNCTSINSRLIAVDVEGVPDITIGADGYGLISYMKNKELRVAHCTSAGCAAHETNTIQVNIYDDYDPPDNMNLVTSIAASQDGLILISYYDWTTQEVKVARCFDAACSNFNIATLYKVSGSDGAFSSIVIGINGMGLLGLSVDGDNSIHFLQCKTLPCIGTQDNEVGYVFRKVPAVAIGQDGLALVAWTNNYGLNTAHCGNVWCNPPININWEETP